jgi:hypothetical protein
MTIAYITVERFSALEERLAAIEAQPGTPALAGEIDRLTDRLDEAERNVAWLRAAEITMGYDDLAEAKALLREAVDIAKGIRGCAERGAPNVIWQTWWARLLKLEDAAVIVAAGGGRQKSGDPITKADLAGVVGGSVSSAAGGGRKVEK